jgi:hypothetical protein
MNEINTGGGGTLDGEVNAERFAGRDAPSNILNFTAPDSLAQNIYYALVRIETKQDAQAERLGKLERWAESQTEKAVVQADRVRNIEGEISHLRRAQDEMRRAQDESKTHREQMDNDIKKLQQQFAAGVQQVKQQVSNIPEQALLVPKTWQWIVLALVAATLLFGSLPVAIQQIVQFLRWIN